MFIWEAKWTHTSLGFQTGVITSCVHMKFHFGCISKRPDILMDMCRHFISGSVYMIFYHPKWNFISVKMTDMKSIPALSFKRTCALNATSNESALIHFVSGKLCSHENLMPVWNFISVNMTDMKSIPFWVSFCLNSCEHKQKADWTPKWAFQPKWNLVWTYSKFWFHELFLIKIKKTTGMLPEYVFLLTSTEAFRNVFCHLETIFLTFSESAVKN